MPILDFNNKQEVDEYENFVLNHLGSSFMQDLQYKWNYDACKKGEK